MPTPPITYLQPYINLIPGTGIEIEIDNNPDGGDNEITITATGAGAVAASSVSVLDTADWFNGTDVETVLAEVGQVLGEETIGPGGLTQGALIIGNGPNAYRFEAIGANTAHLASNGTDALWTVSGTPSTQALGDAASTGTSTGAANSDHKHAMPTYATVKAATAGNVGPTGALHETFPRQLNNNQTQSVLVSGSLLLTAIWLSAGTVVTNIVYTSGTTAANGPTHWWFALFDGSRNLLSQTADQTNTAFGASTAMPKALSTNGGAQTISTAGVYYVGIVMTATVALITLNGFTATGTTVMGLAPILNGQSTTSLTTTAPNPAGAITVQAAMPYVYVT